MENREKPIPEAKLALVKEISAGMKKHKTTLIASCKGLPSSQFHEIKKKLRGKADMRVVKKNIFLRAIKSVGENAGQLESTLDSNFVIFFSNLDAFELSGMLTEIQSSRKAKVGEIAPEDIPIESGPTDLVPGPAISELSSVGLKVIVKDGKLEIQKGAVVAKKGEPITANAAGVMSKLGISPMKVGFLPLAAYENESGKVYTSIRIDKAEAYEQLKEAIKKALGFAASMKYVTKETISYFIAKASAEEKAIGKLITTTREDA